MHTGLSPNISAIYMLHNFKCQIQKYIPKIIPTHGSDYITVKQEMLKKKTNLKCTATRKKDRTRAQCRLEAVEKMRIMSNH